MRRCSEHLFHMSTMGTAHSEHGAETTKLLIPLGDKSVIPVPFIVTRL